MLDIDANRRSRNYTRGEQIRRVVWMLAQPLFRWSPRPCFGWRRWLLQLFGAKLGKSVHVYSSTRIYFPWNLTAGDRTAIGENVLIYNLGPVTLGANVTISHGAHLCAGTHDYTDPAMPLLKPEIWVEDDAWVCADGFVGPGVRVGPGAVVGARAVVMKDVEAWTVVVGNPAIFLKTRVVRASMGKT